MGEYIARRAVGTCAETRSRDPGAGKGDTALCDEATTNNFELAHPPQPSKWTRSFYDLAQIGRTSAREVERV